VQYAIRASRDGSAGIRCIGDYALLVFGIVAGKTRIMADEFISTSGTDITNAYRHYLHPPLGSDLPQGFQLRTNPLAKLRDTPR